MIFNKISSNEDTGFIAKEEGTTRELRVSRTNPKSYRISIEEKIVNLTDEELLKLADTMRDLVVRNSKPTP